MGVQGGACLRNRPLLSCTIVDDTRKKRSDSIDEFFGLVVFFDHACRLSFNREAWALVGRPMCERGGSSPTRHGRFDVSDVEQDVDFDRPSSNVGSKTTLTRTRSEDRT